LDLIHCGGHDILSNKWFFTADCHFGHANIIKYCKRPFISNNDMKICDLIKNGTIPASDYKVPEISIDLMDKTIAKSINEVVGKNDNLVIVGDFCLPHGDKNEKYYRSMINCQNVFLVLGNHDDRDACSDVFTACYENYLFKIDGQKIFVNHYPARSWNKSSQGSWMLYGHVHDAFHDEDNGSLSKHDKHVLSESFASLIRKRGIQQDGLLEELLEIVASMNGSQLTLDVGVDNLLRPDLPFGTPWSMSDIRAYMLEKIPLWNARKTVHRLI